MKKILFNIPQGVQKTIWAHLLPKRFVREQAAFAYAQKHTQNGAEIFQCIDWFPVPPEGFVTQTRFHIELRDEVKASTIKRAHDLGASLVEMHSHLGRWPAAFSISDLLGFREFVPHVWWRLRGRSYLALVVCRSGFDGLAWLDNPNAPQHLDGIMAEDSLLKPTGPLVRSVILMTDLVYDRNIRFFGKDGQQKLAGAHVAIVGIGGLGTHVVQQLALLGVGHLTLIDDEELDVTNRNRYVGVRSDDPIPGSWKVDIGERLAKEINPGICAVPIRHSLVSPQAFEAVIKADYIFGCLDNEGARLVLNEICAAYSRAYFDLASDILPDGKYGGRVCVAWEGQGCLVCCGELDMAQAQADLETPEDRANREAIYGVPREALNQAGPAVVSINGVVASFAVSEFMLGVTGIRPPKRLCRYRGDRGIVVTVTDDQAPDCYYCKGIYGKGAASGVQKYLNAGIR